MGTAQPQRGESQGGSAPAPRGSPASLPFLPLLPRHPSDGCGALRDRPLRDRTLQDRPLRPGPSDQRSLRMSRARVCPLCSLSPKRARPRHALDPARRLGEKKRSGRLLK